jgi:hypothetical protein
MDKKGFQNVQWDYKLWVYKNAENVEIWWIKAYSTSALEKKKQNRECLSTNHHVKKGYWPFNANFNHSRNPINPQSVENIGDVLFNIFLLYCY